MLELFKRSGIPFEVHNSHTTADAPQTVRHVKKKFAKLEQQGQRSVDLSAIAPTSNLTPCYIYNREAKNLRLF